MQKEEVVALKVNPISPVDSFCDFCSTYLLLTLSLALITVYLPTPLYCAELFFNTSLGHNSNPAAEPNARGALFSNYTLSVEHGLSMADKFKLDLTSWVSHESLEGLPDNHQFNANISLSPVNSGKRVTPYLFCSAYLYRDSLIPSDERNRFTLGGGANIILSGRYTLIVEHSWQSIRYLKDAPLLFLPPMDRKIRNNSSLQPMPQPPPQEQVHDARKDLSLMFNTHLNIFFTPSLTASTGLGYEYLSSSLNPESYWQLTPFAECFLNFNDQWQLTMAGQLEARRYIKIHQAFEGNLKPDPINPHPHNSDADIHEINGEEKIHGEPLPTIRDVTYTGSLNLGVHYFPSAPLEIFTEFSVVHGQYALNDESYTERIVKCGFVWSF